MKRLNDPRRLVAKALSGLAVFQAGVLCLLNAIFGRGEADVSIAAVVLALVPLLLARLDRPPRTIGFALAVALVSQTALLVYVFEGHPWQVEMHFYFFAVLAMLAGFCDPQILLAAAGLVAIHHFILNGVLPDALYPGGSDLFRMGVHAAIVIIETTMLILIARLIRESFEAAQTAATIAEDAAIRLESIGNVLEDQLSTSTQRADALETSSGTFKTEVAGHLDHLISSSLSLNGSADDFSQALGMTSAQAAAVSSAAESANRRVGEVASAGRAYLATMTEIGEHACRSARMGVKAVDEAEATKVTMAELTATSQRIEGAVKLIADIAAQTSLLALNATIESARAGQDGRGFSIVAAEVKTLANATSKAAASVADMVANIRGSTQRSVSAMTSIAETIQSLNGATAVIADAVTDRIYVAKEMAQNVDAAASEVQKVTTAIDAIEDVAAHSLADAGRLRVAAAEISERTSMIRSRVEFFTHAVVRVADHREAASCSVHSSRSSG